MILRRKSSAPARSVGPTVANATLPRIPGRNGAASAFTGQTTAVLPNTTMTMGPSAYAPVVYTPIGPDRTRASMAWYFAGTAATDAEHLEPRERTFDRWLGKTRRYEDRGGVRAQDFGCMEMQQAARFSPAADVTRFSPVWEANVHHFQNWVVRTLAG
jgi:hypothetical protein